MAYSSQGSHTDQLDFCKWLADGRATEWYYVLYIILLINIFISHIIILIWLDARRSGAVTASHAAMLFDLYHSQQYQLTIARNLDSY